MAVYYLPLFIILAVEFNNQQFNFVLGLVYKEDSFMYEETYVFMVIDGLLIMEMKHII
jgi:hypothetical protein